MLRFLLAIFLLSAALNTSAQLKQRTADEHFQKLEYFEAAPMYAELANKTIRGKSEPNWENVRRAAHSFKQLYQFNRARFFYSKLHERGMLLEADYVEYIDILRTIGKYEEAELLLDEAVKLYPANDFVSALAERNNRFQHLLADSAIYSVNALSLNSGLGDFCPVYYKQGLLYMSRAKNAGFLNTKYEWDNSYFINMLYSELEPDSSLSTPKVAKDAFFSRAHDGPVSFSPDQNRMVITKNSEMRTASDTIVVLAIYFADRQGDEWGPLKPFPYNNLAYNVGHATFANDGKRIYFASDAPGGKGGADLYYSDYINGSWSEPVNLGDKINTDQDELFPTVLGNTLYYSSRGKFGIGGLDIFYTNTEGNAEPLNMGYPMNTSFDDFGIVVNSDGKGGYFSSNRGDFVDRIYSWKRKDPVINLVCTVNLDYAPKETVMNHPVLFIDVTTGDSSTLITDSLGQVRANLTFNHTYRLSTAKEDFELASAQTVSCEGIIRDTTITSELLLKPLRIQVTLKVVEKGTKKPLSNAKVTVIQPSTAKKVTLQTDKEGLTSMEADRFSEYQAQASKRGYVDDNTTFQTANEHDKVIELLLQLPLIKKGDKFKLENIFYDYNKSTLRPESKASLDRLADFILENKLRVELSSHTDARGTATYNQRLSQARAQSCVDYLISRGVPKAWIVARGYGETQLLNSCKDGVVCSEEQHQENRRTEIKIL